MRVGDEHMAHRFPPHGIEERAYVALVVRARIDDPNAAATHDVGHRTLERERARVIGEHTPDARHHLVRNAGREIELFVEWDVGGHQETEIATALLQHLPHAADYRVL